MSTNNGNSMLSSLRDDRDTSANNEDTSLRTEFAARRKSSFAEALLTSPSSPMFSPRVFLSEEELKPEKKGLLNNWIFCTVIGLFSFCMCNTFMDSNAHLGFTAMLYQNTGTLLIATLYFVFYYISLKNKAAQSEEEFKPSTILENEGFYNLDNKGLRKYLLVNHIDGKFDWPMVGHYFLGSLISTCIFASSALTFSLSNQAGLNSGVAISIWATLPFFAAIVEYLTIKTSLKTYQIVGMGVMLIGACLVSLSDVFYVKDDDKETQTSEQIQDDGEPQVKLPIYMPLLAAFLLPIIGGVASNYTRWVQITKKLSAANWVMGYNLMVNAALAIFAICYFVLQKEEANQFQFNFFWRGAVAGLFGTVGGVFVGLAIATGAPLGPIFALVNLQMVVLTVILVFVVGIIPNGMQWAGLSMSLIAALILTIPDKLLNLWYGLTGCARPSKKQSK